MILLPLFLALPLSVAIPQDGAPSPPRADVEWLWRIERLGAPVVSPAGRWVVAPLTDHGGKDNQARTDLWLFDLQAQVERPLTQHGSADGQAVFSPDGGTLAFVTKREDDEAPQLYLLPMDTPGEARRLTEVPTGVSAPKWAGEYVYFLSRVWPGQDWDAMAERMKQEKDSKVSARAWSALPTRHWDHWLDGAREVHLFRVPAAGGPVEALSEPTGWALPPAAPGAEHYDVAPDGAWVVIQSDSNRDAVRPNLDLFLFAPGSADARNLTEDNPAPDGQPLFSPDGRTLAYARQRIAGFYSDTRRLVLFDLERDAHHEPFPEWDRSLGPCAWMPDGSGLVSAIDDAGTRRLYFIGTGPADLAPESLTGTTSFESPAVAPDGTLVAVNSSFLFPARLVHLDRRSGDVRRLDTRNDGALGAVSLGTYESVTYAGAEGAPIQMWVHYPPDFDSARRYPLLLLVHGGPHSAIVDSFSYRWNAQVFAAWGYVVAWHNFHGSSGFGQDFADAINPDWFTKPYADTLAAARWFAERPFIDPERMVAAGASYGGYLTSAILGHEHPFKTLVIHAPVYNLYSQMAADFAVHSMRFGDYWDDPRLYGSISPHYFAKGFATPSLILHGELDYRVPVGQAFELFRALQHRGIESRLVYFPDENHWILKRDNSIHWHGEVRAWVERFAPPTR